MFELSGRYCRETKMLCKKRSRALGLGFGHSYEAIARFVYPDCPAAGLETKPRLNSFRYLFQRSLYVLVVNRILA